MAIDGASRENFPVTGDNLCRGPDHQARCDVVHDVRVAGLSNGGNTPVPHADVGLYHTGVIEDDRRPL